jgi:hypothetical protein
MTGPKPAGPTHPTPTHPPRPARSDAPLPRLGSQIRDVEHLVAQALAIIDRESDPASLPPLKFSRHGVEALRMSIGFHAEAILRDCDAITRFNLPPVGSAAPIPARADPGP